MDVAILGSGPTGSAVGAARILSTNNHDIQLVESATDYISTGCFFPERLTEVVQIQPLPSLDFYIYTPKNYAPEWGSQGLLFRYNPKTAHNKIKPSQGYRIKMLNRKYQRRG